jgi:hypothetical protein
MPVIYKYLGIIFSFYSNEHNPIHIHAEYDGAIMKVEFLIKEGIVRKVIYKQFKGRFHPARIKDLEAFVAIHKEDIVKRWDDYFIWKKKVKRQVITRKIK